MIELFIKLILEPFLEEFEYDDEQGLFINKITKQKIKVENDTLVEVKGD